MPSVPTADPDSTGAVHARAHPSLALVKYWGKRPGGTNIPATSSLAVTLDALSTDTVCRPADEDSLEIDGRPQPPGRIAPFFDRVRETVRCDTRFAVSSRNSFPTAAGLASSASGFAALALATVAAAGGDTADRHALSALARQGSGSASRSVFGGFTAWDAGATAARQLHDERWWPELRIVVAPVHGGPKPVSSRDAMNLTRDSSPFYDAWVADAPALFQRAEAALDARDLERLGTVMRESTMRMFATMLGAAPPILYWRPQTIEVLQRLAELRRRGTAAWETMDAGPQVKILTTADDADAVAREVSPWCATSPVISTVGGDACLVPGHEPRERDTGKRAGGSDRMNHT